MKIISQLRSLFFSKTPVGNQTSNKVDHSTQMISKRSLKTPKQDNIPFKEGKFNVEVQEETKFSAILRGLTKLFTSKKTNEQSKTSALPKSTPYTQRHRRRKEVRSDNILKMRVVKENWLGQRTFITEVKYNKLSDEVSTKEIEAEIETSGWDRANIVNKVNQLHFKSSRIEISKKIVQKMIDDNDDESIVQFLIDVDKSGRGKRGDKAFISQTLEGIAPESSVGILSKLFKATGVNINALPQYREDLNITPKQFPPKILAALFKTDDIQTIIQEATETEILEFTKSDETFKPMCNYYDASDLENMNPDLKDKLLSNPTFTTRIKEQIRYEPEIYFGLDDTTKDKLNETPENGKTFVEEMRDNLFRLGEIDRGLELMEGGIAAMTGAQWYAKTDIDLRNINNVKNADGHYMPYEAMEPPYLLEKPIYSSTNETVLENDEFQIEDYHLKRLIELMNTTQQKDFITAMENGLESGNLDPATQLLHRMHILGYKTKNNIPLQKSDLKNMPILVLISLFSGVNSRCNLNETDKEVIKEYHNQTVKDTKDALNAKYKERYIPMRDEWGWVATQEFDSGGSHQHQIVNYKPIQDKDDNQIQDDDASFKKFYGRG